MKPLEKLLIRSFDQSLSASEEKILMAELARDKELKDTQKQIIELRKTLAHIGSYSFHPSLSEHVLMRIKKLSQSFDYQVVLFFKKHLWQAITLIIILLSINLFLADSLSIESVLGLEDQDSQNLVEAIIYEQFNLNE